METNLTNPTKMASSSPRPHAVLIPQPAQGHVTPMLQLAKILHSKGFFITYVNSQYNDKRFLRANGPDSLNGLEDFKFESIPDGLPPSDDDVTQDIADLCISTTKKSADPFRDLLIRLNNCLNNPPVSCVIADGVMSFAQRIAEELGILALVFWTTSACGFNGYLHFAELIQRGYTPLKDDSYLTNGYLDTPISWIPGMPDVRLKDIPSFIRTTDRGDIMLNFDGGEAQNALKAQGLILNTFDSLEHEILEALREKFPRLFAIGPLSLLVNKLHPSEVDSIGSSLWNEDATCLDWLDKHEPCSVVYVNFGSITVMTAEQLSEFAWGLANSKKPFLWITRPDLVSGESVILPKDFIIETKDRGVLANWCPQNKVLLHPSIGVFLTHCGWNSTLESICGGVPMICWPFFAEQPTNCRYVCAKWGIGLEIDADVRRDDVERLVRETMEREKGKDMRVKAKMWNERAEEAIEQGGPSNQNLDDLVQFLLKRTL
ncbi:hypothetical protein LUZ60_001199 [Juncus effusus]|nr:hypothetical protein LUZ60_001199 [Juncus effusus]